MNEFLQQFLIESRELVVQATEGLLLLEQAPLNTEYLDSVFRAFHTLKGGAGIVEFAAMELTVHTTESLLTEVRSGNRHLNPILLSDCLTCLDQVSQWLDILEQTGELPVNLNRPLDAVIDAARLTDMITEYAPSSSVNPMQQEWMTDLLERHPDILGQATVAFRFKPDSDCFYKNEDPIAQISSLHQLLALELEPANPWPPLDNFDPYTCNLVLTGLTGSSVSDVSAHMQSQSGDCEILAIDTADTLVTHSSLPKRMRELLQEQVAILDEQGASGASGRLTSAGLTAANAMRFAGRDAQAETLEHATKQSLAEKSPQTLRNAITQLLTAESAAPSLGSPIVQRTETSVRTLRVNAEQIDALVRLTGELTVVKNAIGHTVNLAQTNADSVAGLLKEHHGVINRLIVQLQHAAIAMRVLPLRTVFQRLPRVLREMSSSLGKPTKLQLEGEDTEADKQIVEMLFEPLLHVVRNAIDHGVETDSERRKRGKPAVATIQIRARRDGEQVLIEVSDDGAGIDVERVRKVASDRGMVADKELHTLTDSAVIDLVFAPGFSTAARVTEISGRGVGMDAVRAAVEKVGGRVAIASHAGQGTTVSFSLPFSVMITQVMTVEAGGQMFGIPLDTVVETLRVAKEAIAGVGDARVIVHRNRTIPVVELDSMLNPGRDTKPGDATDATVIIVAVGGELVAIHVDRPGERVEVILKPLDGLLSGTPGIVGTTVLGDGRVLLVLDIADMLQ